MVCYDLNVVFTPVAENAETLFFAFAGDSPKNRRTGRPANENPQALRAVIYIKHEMMS